MKNYLRRKLSYLLLLLMVVFTFQPCISYGDDYESVKSDVCTQPSNTGYSSNESKTLSDEANVAESRNFFSIVR